MASLSGSQRGQSLIIIALLMVGMLGILGLVLDGGAAFMTKRNSQDAADAAAFAGVRVLATRSVTTTEQNVWDAIRFFAKANQVVTDTDVIATFIRDTGADICVINQTCGGIPTSPLATGVRVTTTLRLQPYFISLLIGNQPVPILSVAAAQSGPPTVGSLLTPMGVYCTTTDPNCNSWQIGQTVRLFGDNIASGGFQWLDFHQTNPYTGIGCKVDDYMWLTCSSGPVARDPSDTYYHAPPNDTDFNLTQPPFPPSPSPWINQGTGTSLGNIPDVLDCWINPYGKYHQNTRNCWLETHQGPRPANRLWIVPVFDHDNSRTGSNAWFHTVRFAEFDFQGYYFANNQCNWVGKTASQSCQDVATLTMLTPTLPNVMQNCALSNSKCIMGAFQQDVTDLGAHAGVCNNNALNVCAFGLSQ